MTTPETDAQQLARRFDLKDKVDALRDAIYVPGPSMQEHLAALRVVNDAVPAFFLTAAFALGAYLNNQPGEVDAETIDALVYLSEEYGEDARGAAFDSGARVLGGALNDLGVALSLAGKIEWEDKTPDA